MTLPQLLERDRIYGLRRKVARINGILSVPYLSDEAVANLSKITTDLNLEVAVLANERTQAEEGRS